MAWEREKGKIQVRDFVDKKQEKENYVFFDTLLEKNSSLPPQISLRRLDIGISGS